MVEILSTCIYGFIYSISKKYDTNEILGNKIFDYKIKSIKCQIKNNRIYGIQILYKEIKGFSEIICVEFKSDQIDLEEKEIILDDDDDIIDVQFYLNDDIILTGFKVITNKGHSAIFGTINQFRHYLIESGEKVVIGFIYCSNREGVTAMGIHYVDKEHYQYVNYCDCRYLILRMKLRDEVYREKIKKKINDINERNKLLYRISSLSDNNFFNIIKYTMGKILKIKNN